MGITYVNRVILTLGTIPLGYKILWLHMLPIKNPASLMWNILFWIGKWIGVRLRKMNIF